MSNYNRAIKKMNARLEKVLKESWYLVHGLTVDILWKDYGYRKKRITDIGCYSGEVWHELAEAGTSCSALEKCEEETGIEIILEGKKSYHEYAYLDHTKWDGKMPTLPQQIYIMERQIEWIPTMLFACICVALHRKEKWGYERLARFMGIVHKRMTERPDAKELVKKCIEEYDIELLYI